MPPRTKAKRSPSRAPGSAYADKYLIPDCPAGHRYWVLEVPHHEQGRIAHHGAKYVEVLDPRRARNVRGWVYVGAYLPESLQPYEAAPYSLQAWYQDDLNGTAPTVAPGSDFTTGTYNLREDQIAKRDTALHLWQSGGPEILDSSSTGVGKTLTNVAIVKALPDVLNVLVIAPKGVLPNWWLHLRDAGDGGKRWLRINYESVRNLLSLPTAVTNLKRAGSRNAKRVDVGVPMVRWDVIICDESQLRGNPHSLQSRTIDKLIAHNNAFVLNLSATPGDSPAKLSYLHRGLAHATGDRVAVSLSPESYADWAVRHGLNVRATKTTLKWEPNSSDAATINQYLFAATPTWSVTGKPEHWPEQVRIPFPVELTSAERLQYQEAWAEFSSRMRQLSTQMQAARRRGSARAINEVRKAGLEAQIRYRQKAAVIRAPHVAAHIKDLIDQGYQVAASFEFTNSSLTAARDALDALNIPTALHTGSNTSTREDERIAYQRGEFQAILFSTTAGINLHAGDTAVEGNNAPRITVIADPRWTGVAALQIEGRGQRNGTDAPAHYMYALGTIEEKVMKRMLMKMKTTKAIVGQDTFSLDDIAADMGFDLFDET